MKNGWVIAIALIAASCSDPFAADPVRAYTKVTTGGDHSCALAESGEAYCWGRGTDGQLGTGSKENRATPGKVLGGVAFKDVSAGDAHTCALATDGTAYCWGWNAYFQRGNATEARDAEPVPVQTDKRFLDISAGAHHTCALGTDSIAYCWGWNRHGQLGDGTVVTNPAPVAVLGSARFARISSGGFHTCGVTRTGESYCWGANDFGQLGVGSSEVRLAQPTRIAGNVGFRLIDGGRTHTCGVATAAERFYCWGSSEYGELGDGAAFKPGLPGALVPRPVSTNFAAGSLIDAGVSHTCASAANGSARCWGRGAYGQLANGSTADNYHPQPVNLMAREIRFSDLGLGGFTHACGIVDRSVYCWGTGAFGQLGAESPYSFLPLRVHD